MTLHDFDISASSVNDKKTDIPQISYSVKAKTYRYVGATETTDVDVKAKKNDKKVAKNDAKADAGGTK